MNLAHRSIALLVVAWSASPSASAHAQAAPLAPVDFVVAGIPGNQPPVDVSVDTARIRRILGAPRSVTHDAFQPGDTLTTWRYDGLYVVFGSIARVGITVTSPRFRTPRGLAV